MFGEMKSMNWNLDFEIDLFSHEKVEKEAQMNNWNQLFF